ncbi:SRPBCC family protein [Catellatospora bangladeshensis]|uniref:Uncharacterized protein n=1 Tax=Catellatospora bangladeshensis TaxID=310355 RepID=A0A8J3JG26_9ACTN|nr:SRPBCC family protein [Catellatospora bangladeshensis]GIF82004.1 hypothetical protein Cba03nite_33530 [Catellatospora bangladeshensis]
MTDVGPDVSGIYAVAAPAEVVFGTLTDPDRTTRWLPGGAVAEYDGPELVRVRAGDRVLAFRVSTAAEELRMEWSAAAGDGPHGSMRVQDSSVGGSTVEVQLWVAAEGLDLDRVRALVEEGVMHLRRDVEDNFNAG